MRQYAWQERLDWLKRRAEFLARSIEHRSDVDLSFDKAERAVLLWAIENIAVLDSIAEVVRSDQADAEKVATIMSLCRSRLRPSEADLERTPGLARRHELEREK